MVRGGSKNRHLKDIMCLKEIGLCAWNLLTVIGSIANISGVDLYDHFIRVSTL